ncbi:spore coat protein U domain-containing protein [Zavarzinia compransoris]|uniref:Csu type fimbrial protein n=1 Tax=Zavarzinia marina TaxID=2911065 RepID=UPI001F39CB35|nr:spore coat U domain-containing protein [Zavarzinia marina]MCF4165008.1 spore coat protein U domain-containing protein [Zavarzinia marina]
MRSLTPAYLALGLLFSGAAGALAADYNAGSFEVTATVSDSCAVTLNDLDFGAYDAGSNKTGSTTLEITCTTGTAYQVGADKGANGADTSNREMKLTTGTDLLGYTLTIGTNGGSHLGSNWGDDTAGGSDTIDGTGTGAAVTVTIDGDIPASQYVTAGSYSDTVNVTVAY